MKNFYPILKTKQSVESKIIKNYSSFFNQNFMLFLEFTKPFDHKISQRFIKIINDKKIDYIGIKYPDKGKLSLAESIEYAKELLKSSKHVTPCCYVNTRTDLTEINTLLNFITLLHNQNRSIALRVQTGTNLTLLNSINDYFSTNDLLFVDIEDSSFNSNEFYLRDLNDIFKNKCINILYEDRNPKMNGKEYANNDWDYSFNTDIIETIKKDSFIFPGFSTYCGIKNNLTEEVPIRKVFPVFPIYDHNENMFFVFTDKESNQIHAAYTKLKNIINTTPALKGKLDELLSETPLSKELYEKLSNKTEKKNTCSEFILVSTIHFFEEMKDLLKF